MIYGAFEASIRDGNHLLGAIARFYDASTGQFISEDSYYGQRDDPQTLFTSSRIFRNGFWSGDFMTVLESESRPIFAYSLAMSIAGLFGGFLLFAIVAVYSFLFGPYGLIGTIWFTSGAAIFLFGAVWWWLRAVRSVQFYEDHAKFVGRLAKEIQGNWDWICILGSLQRLA